MTELEEIYYDGFDKLMTFKPSPELAEAMDATMDAVYAAEPEIQEQMLEDLVDEFSDMLYEQERANWYRHMIDPMFDEVRQYL